MKEINVLMLINLLCVSAMMAFVAVVGPIVRELHMEEWHAGLMVGIAGVLWIIFSRFWGKRSDIVGRRPILITCVTGMAIAYLVLAMFVDYALSSPPTVFVSLLILILARGSIGAFHSAITPVSNALIADHVTKEKRTKFIAKLAATNGIAMVVGPTVGGGLANYGLSVPLYTFAILPLISVFIIIYTIPKETPRKHEDIPVPKIFDERLRLPMIAAFVTMYGIVTSQICLGFYIIDTFALSSIAAAKVTGYILAFLGVVFIASQIIVTKLSITAHILLKYGSLIASFGFLIILPMSTKILLTLAFGIATFGMGMLFPAFQTLAVNMVTQEEQGAASGTVSAAQGFGMVVAPITSTMFYEITTIAPFLVASIIFGLFHIFYQLYGYKYLKIKE